ncbi:DUF2922 domain-containing protein [Staphylococcus muscae]|uniref:Protein of uncharacterized function (DUF2922) n=1 Tax=Staphylococcus muscae TaxID=1294 RepID=A0A240BUS9_9STAP|nr:DUF2922 domain-containing protein [Staphylococcus muscae]AVQ34212.1 DUF2922 domain-containing protein [Staphylococcus muscae]PNZ01099.1 DUF2922 domain-containing protein [Staphylococcus muscae]GGA85174.1 hypothetical protein GCM10007183_06700 [Staphylococcus muscae]SNV99474.1 Protein of uncharacterised function (DUF2922) [Staphylococcus muscae]
MNSKTLDITFDTLQQKPVRLTLPNIKLNIDKELAVAQAENLVKLNILTTPALQVTHAKTAQLIDKTITILF